ncbi:hypothetical protein V8J84_09675 [Yoonia sp. 208BN28-4]|uniref:hypothetical protein n=1 Tax=Yoonia sp. 208BN28-4 TaxID=3126505 RepID=UPI0030A301A8
MTSVLLCSLAALPATAQTDQPLSAIDWLSRSVTAPVAPTTVQPPLNEPPVTDSASTPQITMTPLDAPSPDPVGLLPPDVTGLPRSLWSASDESMVITLVQAERTDSLPAIQDFLMTLMLAEADAPLGAGTDGALFVARVDKLLDYGAIEQAQALLEQTDIEEPELFRRWFDVALLTGSEDRACDVMQANPQVAPTYAARIFCLARSGEWPAAALTLNTHRALGDVSPEEEALLSRFLDPELYEDDGALPPPSRISPLVFRMREAIGEGLPTSNLPRAFAHADLRDTVGWKSQLEAAERLVRHGAADRNVLAGFYLARTPSASGGVWDRVEAMQRFVTALDARDPGAVSETLPAAWDAAQRAQIEVPFAALYSAQLQGLPLSEGARDTAFTIGLLSGDYETVALNAGEDSDPFLVALARGFPDEVETADDTRLAIQAAYVDATPPDALTTLVNDGKLGEALLRNVALFDSGLSGDTRAITQAIALFRMVGLEDVARRAALQFLLLDRAA